MLGWPANKLLDSALKKVFIVIGRKIWPLLSNSGDCLS